MAPKKTPLYVFAACLITALGHAALAKPLQPVIDGGWQVAGNPDLGPVTSPKQQPVDFGVWQLWSCIRHTNCGGHTRLFHRWQGKDLTDTDWMPKGIRIAKLKWAPASPD